MHKYVDYVYTIFNNVIIFNNNAKSIVKNA